jgi:hypothetical protein
MLELYLTLGLFLIKVIFVRIDQIPALRKIKMAFVEGKVVSIFHSDFRSPTDHELRS